MIRRHVLTGLVAAPAIARLGLLMPIRPLEPIYGIDPGGASATKLILVVRTTPDAYPSSLDVDVGKKIRWVDQMPGQPLPPRGWRFGVLL